MNSDGTLALANIEVVFADSGAEGGNERLNLAVTKHLVKASFLDVQDLAFERQDGLVLSIAALFG